MGVKTLAGRLATNFGDAEAMAQLYAPNIQWRLCASLPFARPMKGKEVVAEFNRVIWRDHFYPEVQVELLDEIGDDALSAARIDYSAKFRATDHLYTNEYTLFVRSAGGMITHVFEGLDTAAMVEQLQGLSVGSIVAGVLDEMGLGESLQG